MEDKLTVIGSERSTHDLPGIPLMPLILGRLVLYRSRTSLAHPKGSYEVTDLESAPKPIGRRADKAGQKLSSCASVCPTKLAPGAPSPNDDCGPLLIRSG